MTDNQLRARLRRVTRVVHALERALVCTHGDDVLQEHNTQHPPARNLLYAADALTFAIARYRAEHQPARPREPLPF